eukprot:gene39923-49345_t
MAHVFAGPGYRSVLSRQEYQAHFETVDHANRNIFRSFRGDQHGKVPHDIFKLRYDVYCIECAFLPQAEQAGGMELDEYETRAVHIAAYSMDEKLIGTVRLVQPDAAQPYPFERHCAVFDHFDHPPRESTAARATASTGTARPQLSAAQAAHYSYSEVLKYAGPAGNERVDPWDPLADPLAKGAAFTPTYVVDAAAKADGVKTFNTVQAAVSRAAAAGQRERVYILLKPGVYKELVYVPASAAPLTLYGEGASAAATKITARLDAAATGASYTAQYAAQFAAADPAIQAMYAIVKERAAAGNGNIGTFGSMTMWVRNNGFQARNLTIENGYNKDTGNAREECGERPCGKTDIDPQKHVVHHQAVALQVEGADKVQFENVRLIGYQDTLFLRAADTRVTVRSFFNKSYIEGDVDFIFGDSTAYLLQTEIKSLGDRSTSYVGAPNTNHRTRYGLVFEQCRFTHDGSPFALAGKFYLARQWFHSSRCTPYGTVPLPGYACVLGAASQFKSPSGTITPTVLETV